MGWVKKDSKGEIRMKQVLYATIMGTMLFVSVNGFAEKVYTESEIKSCGWSLTCTSDDVPLTGVVKRYYENGKLRGEATYKNGKKNGIVKWYHKNGNLRGEITYRDGKEEGSERWYHENGDLDYEEIYKDGVCCFHQRKFYPSKNVYTYKDVQKCTKDDELLCTLNNLPITGVLKEYYDNGNLKSETTYKDGKKEGVSKIYKINGLMDGYNDYHYGSRKYFYKVYDPNESVYALNEVKSCYDNLLCTLNGVLVTGIVQEYHKNGYLKHETDYKDGVKEGFERWYYSNGDLDSERFYVNGKLDGQDSSYYGNPDSDYKDDECKDIKPEERHRYHPVGSYWDVTNYKNGKKHGVSRSYYYNKLAYEENYKDDKLDGPWKSYHYFMGMLAGEGYYKDGKEEGFEKRYDEHGNLENTRFYKDGLLEGVYVEYGENGVLAKEINFQKGEPVLGYIYDIYGNKTPMSQDELASVEITD